jgi:hypothetical protein
MPSTTGSDDKAVQFSATAEERRACCLALSVSFPQNTHDTAGKFVPAQDIDSSCICQCAAFSGGGA